MRVRLIKKKSIDEFAMKNARSRVSLKLWYSLIKNADWKVSQDICETFRTADLLGNGSNRVVFDIAGNHYRLICAYYFGNEYVHLFVKWIGTHAEYDQLCNENRQYSVNSF